MAFFVSPAAPVTEHALILFFRCFRRPALEAVDLIEKELALWRDLIAVNPVLAVIRACALVAPKSRLVLKQLLDLFHARILTPGNDEIILSNSFKCAAFRQGCPSGTSAAKHHG